MPERLLIKNGLVIDPSQRLEAVRDVLIENGKISAVAAGLSRRADLKGVASLDAEGCWVTPGLIDMHVHLREPGRESEETIASGSAAAAAGGFTTVLAMPNTEPAVDTPALVRQLRAKAEREACVNVLFAAAVTLGQKGERLTEIAGLSAAGAAALSDDGRPVATAELMRRALEHAADCGLLVIDHCEDLTLSCGGAINEGPAATAKGLKGVPNAAETILAWRDIELSALTGAPVHLAHVSAAETVAAVRLAKKRGLRVSAEAAPHHWTLLDSGIPGYDAAFKMNPPLRGERDREALLEGLSDGTIDAIATDHAPHAASMKALGLGPAPCGVIGLETALGLALTQLAAKKIVSPKRLVELMSCAPARLLGLKSKGGLKPGQDGDLTVVDPSASWTVAEPFLSKSRNSPFLGRKLRGRARATVAAGRVVHAL